MKKLLVLILALSIATIMYNESFAEKNTFFDSVKFIQYLDENTALEEVRNGNLDVYYYTISSDRLENYQAREGLQVFDSTGGSYSILVNPAESEEFNPFSSRDIRFALNYLIDRKLIVNELMGGYGSPIISYYSPSDPEYLTVIEQLEAFNFKYNPALAEEIISRVLKEKGAVKIDDKWQIDAKPIEITIFIRSDDTVRKSIGEILASELQKIGFTIKKYRMESEWSVSTLIFNSPPLWMIFFISMFLIIGNSGFSNSAHSPILNGYESSSNALTVIVRDSGEYDFK